MIDRVWPVRSDETCHNAHNAVDDMGWGSFQRYTRDELQVHELARHLILIPLRRRMHTGRDANTLWL